MQGLSELLLAKEIIEKGLTVRDAEKFRKIEKKEKKEDNMKTQIAEYITELETKVSKSVGNRVKRLIEQAEKQMAGK